VGVSLCGFVWVWLCVGVVVCGVCVCVCGGCVVWVCLLHAFLCN